MTPADRFSSPFWLSPSGTMDIFSTGRVPYKTPLFQHSNCTDSYLQPSLTTDTITQIHLSFLFVDAKMPWRNNINISLLIDGIVLALTHQLTVHPQLSSAKPTVFPLVCFPWPCLHAATTQTPLSVEGMGFIASVSAAAEHRTMYGLCKQVLLFSFAFPLFLSGKSVHSKTNKNQKV